MTVDELRTAFLEFFEARGHRRIPSSSLVPHGDPTLLFTNAGMVQFKPYFMGLEEPPAPRLTSIQRCFRTTDVEDVGDDTHLTMFEMLGNFSVGDYFKPEAIEWAWEFLTGVLGIPEERLWATVFLTDDEAFELWERRGVPPERISRYTAAQGNWWGPPGDNGPCGPCSELHYDWGPTEGCRHCEAGECHPDIECGRFLEIWNLVFMTYFQDDEGVQTDLPAANIDTGAGLERLASVLQDVRAVYETDELREVVAAAEGISGRTYDPEENYEVAQALRVMTDHARAISFLINDGVLPSNEGRGYVLRRVLRRAIYFANRIGRHEPFLEELVGTAIEHSLQANAELADQREFIQRLVGIEERRFLDTLDRGLELLEDVLERERESKRIPGRDMFTLYDTHGLPPELTIEVARERGYEVDETAFEAEMEAQRERSKGAEFTVDDTDRAQRYASLELTSTFAGYDGLTARGEVTFIAQGSDRVDQLSADESGEVVLDTTALYAEGGGQVADRGEIVTPSGRFAVEDVQQYGDAIVHSGRVTEGSIALGEAAEATVDGTWRRGSERNHTGTHLLHAALRQMLGSHVRQAGSYVGPDRLRFDYTHPEAPTAEELRSIQRLVNEKIRENILSETLELDYEEAIARGAIAFFEDRYTARVRMVEYCEARGMGHEHSAECYSRELCGGTHLRSTGEIGILVIVADSSIGAGMRRIEALTGPEAEAYSEARSDQVTELSHRFRVPDDEVLARIDALEEQLAAERRRADEAELAVASGAADDLVGSAVEIDGTHVVISRVVVDSADAMKPMVDRLRSQLGSAFVTLAAEVDGRPMFIAAATDDVVERGLRADEVVRAAAQIAGGGGGGRPQLAQAGGRDASKIDEALAVARDTAQRVLGGDAS